MAYEEETRFVRSFIRKDRRERLLHELTDPKKRNAGLSRFCHQADDFLDAARISMKGSDLERQPGFAEFAAKHSGMCRVISADLWLDEYLPLKDAVEQAGLCFDAVLILGDGFAVVFAEACKGGRDKYLLCG